MRPYFMEQFGNAASRSHPFGWAAEAAVETARSQIAQLIGCKPMEVVFTSGATESDNLAIKGVAYAYREKGNHLITSQIEHHAVLDSCKRLEKEGFEVTYLPVSRDGLVDPADRGQGHYAQDHPGVHHAGEQRDRDDPAPGGDRKHL